MSGHIIKDSLIIAGLIIFSAYFSATETAFTSINRIKLKNMAEDGNRRAERVLKLSGKYDKLLTTILIGNNIVNIAMTSIATIMFVSLLGAYGATVATAVITVSVLVFGEITPKSIAKENPENFAMISAPLLDKFMMLLAPVNFLFTRWKKFVARVLKLSSTDKITEEELIIIVDEAERTGTLDGKHSKLIQNAIKFHDLRAEDVMTPRPKMNAIDSGCPEEELVELFSQTGFSRMPVYEGDIDRIIGVINYKEFYNHVAGGRGLIADYVTPVVFVGTRMKVSDLLKKMQQIKTHMAIVVDEYGGTKGLVTMEDMIEELVGEIFDEHDTVISKGIMPLQNGSYRVKCSTNISKVFDYLEINEVPATVTINGWVAMEMDRLPKTGDTFETTAGDKRLKVIVTRADERKALEINLTVEDSERGTENGPTGKDLWRS